MGANGSRSGSLATAAFITLLAVGAASGAFDRTHPAPMPATSPVFSDPGAGPIVPGVYGPPALGGWAPARGTLLTPRDVGAGMCLQDTGDPHALRAAPGDLNASRSLFVSHNRTVDADNRTVANALALASVLDSPVGPVDIFGARDQRVEVCLFEVVSTLDASRLGWPAGVTLNGSSSRLLLVRFETMTQRSVWLNDTVTVAALALSKHADIRLEDVIDVREAAWTTRTYERYVDLEPDHVLLTMAGVTPWGTGTAAPNLVAPAPAPSVPAPTASPTPPSASAGGKWNGSDTTSSRP